MEVKQIILEPLSDSKGSLTSTLRTTPKINGNLSTVYLVSQVLQIDRAHIDDNENITCQAENDVGKATTTVHINVHCESIVQHQQNTFIHSLVSHHLY